MIDKLTHIFSWIFFVTACIFSLLYIIDRVLYRLGWDFLWMPITHDRLLDFIGIALLFIITLLLRQIREALKK